jgi:ferredoxin--NADP+ reductase
MSAFQIETVVDVRHWTDRLFSFRTTRDPSFRFASGQFVMIGLEIGGRPLMRAYSLASASYDDHLEFFSIKVENGPLTSVLKNIRIGDTLLVGRKATGTLLCDNLREGRNLFLVGTGTGLALFLSLIRDPEIYEKFEKVVVVHGCRFAGELAYADFITQDLPNDELVGAGASRKLIYYPTVTREAANARPRVTEQIRSGEFSANVDLPVPDPRHDRFMLCGSSDMLRDMRQILEAARFEEGSQSKAGDYVFERAFVD